jgi:DNA-binding FrmR family transcriptional regulator
MLPTEAPHVVTSVHNAHEVTARVERMEDDTGRCEDVVWLTIAVNGSDVLNVFARTKECEEQLMALTRMINQARTEARIHAAAREL